MENRNRKGILLAGGNGTRLYPLTCGASKHLLPIYDKPMIFYSLSLLMLADIREIIVITSPRHHAHLEHLLGDGSQWGVQLQYAIQEQPNGIAEALIIAKEFLAGAPCCLVLGDNLLYGHQLTHYLKRASSREQGACLLTCHVNNPSEYGVVELSEEGEPLTLEEKPVDPRSNMAVTGIYFYDEQAPLMAETLVPSSRGELEITDLNQLYLDKKSLHVMVLNRGFTWFDTGTHTSINEASDFIQAIERRTGLKIGCPEEIAYMKRWVDAETILANIEPYAKSDYSKYIKSIISKDLKKRI